MTAAQAITKLARIGRFSFRFMRHRAPCCRFQKRGVCDRRGCDHRSASPSNI